MKLTRAQKRMVGVLVAAVSAFVVDAAFLQPASVSGAVSPDDAAADDASSFTAPTPAPDAKAQGVLAARRGSVATQIAELDGAARMSIAPGSIGEERLTSLFARPASWTIPADEADDAAGQEIKPAAAKLELTSVMSGGPGAVAIINGASVSVGDRVSGYTVRAIGEAGVVLVDDAGERLRLALKRKR
jgi:hypothetical protein